jgi:hypothetical protein
LQLVETADGGEPHSSASRSLGAPTALPATFSEAVRPARRPVTCLALPMSVPQRRRTVLQAHKDRLCAEEATPAFRAVLQKLSARAQRSAFGRRSADRQAVHLVSCRTNGR